MTAYVASVLVAFAPHPACAKTYTVPMAQRAAMTAYAGTRTVTAKDRRHLARFLRCQRNPAAKGFVRWFYARQRQLHGHRVVAASIQQALASWYLDSVGQTACGYHAGMGVANRYLPCGTRVAFYYGGRTAVAVVDDRGPYAGGRDWDLNQNTASALGFTGVHAVGYRVLGR